MNRYLAAAAMAVALSTAFVSTASAAPAMRWSGWLGTPSVQVRTPSRVQQVRHPFYRSWGNHYGFGPGHHQY